MDDILTVTLNPALDIATETAAVSPGPKLRCSDPVFDPGGGGVNVSRAIKKLKGSSRAFLLAGGPFGDLLLSALEAEGIETEVLTVKGMTRISLAVFDESISDQFRFILPGPEISPEEVKAAMDRIVGLAQDRGIVVLSGSQAPGTAETFPARLCARLNEAGVRLFVDTSGAALKNLVDAEDARPFFLRLNRSEAEEIAGGRFARIQDAADFGTGLVARGAAKFVAIGFDAEGSLLVSKSKQLFCQAPPVPARSKTGAGDSFMAAFVLSIAGNECVETALRRGVAASAAAVMSEATKLCGAADTELLLEGCRLREI